MSGIGESLAHRSHDFPKGRLGAFCHAFNRSPPARRFDSGRPFQLVRPLALRAGCQCNGMLKDPAAVDGTRHEELETDKSIIIEVV